MKRALGALLSLLLGGLLAEIAVRLIGEQRFVPSPLLPYDVAEPIRSGMRVSEASSYLVFDADLGWRVGPDRHSRNGLYNSDASGRRVSASAPDDVPPWATAFGDSFTHGDDVRDDETWLARLSDHGLPVSNFAVPGYGVDQARLRYRSLKSQIRSGVVLIGVMADNIGRHLNRYRPFITPAERVFFVKPRFEKKGDQLALVPSPFRVLEDYAVSPAALRKTLFEVGEKDRFFDRRLYEASWFDRSRLFRLTRTLVLNGSKRVDWRLLYQDDEAVGLTLAIVQGFAQEVRHDGRLPVIIFLPEKTVAEDVVEGRTPPTAVLVDRLRRLDFPVVDLTVPVAGFAKTAGEKAAFLPHYSPALCQAVADYIADWKKTEKSLP